MQIELTRGCISGSLTVDGTEEIHLTDEQRMEIKKRIGEWLCSSKISLNELLVLLAENFYDDYESDDEPCECCGDFAETYKLKIEP